MSNKGDPMHASTPLPPFPQATYQPMKTVGEEDGTSITELITYKNQLEESDTKIALLFAASLVSLLGCWAINSKNYLNPSANPAIGPIVSICIFGACYGPPLINIFVQSLLSRRKYAALEDQPSLKEVVDKIADLEVTQRHMCIWSAGSFMTSLTAVISGAVILRYPELASEAAKTAWYCSTFAFMTTLLIAVSQNALPRKNTRTE